MSNTKHKGVWIPDNLPVGVCLWKTPDGFISDGDGYLSMEGVIGNRIIESKMRAAAKYWTGEDNGEPKWFPGYRKITQMEYEDQMARLIDGEIPDEQDAARQARGEV